MSGSGRWGCLVTAASLSVLTLRTGLTWAAFPILYSELVIYFRTSTASVGWVASIFSFFNFAICLVASPFVERYGSRTFGQVSTIIASIGLILASLSTTLPLLYLGYGVVAGSGIGAASFAAMIPTQLYFTKRRCLAAGVSSMGVGLGQLAFAPVIRWLLDQYGWRGTLLLSAGLNLHCIIFCVAFRQQQTEHMFSKTSVVEVLDKPDCKDSRVASDNLDTGMESSDTIPLSHPSSLQIKSQFCSKSMPNSPLTSRNKTGAVLPLPQSCDKDLRMSLLKHVHTANTLNHESSCVQNDTNTLPSPKGIQLEKCFLMHMPDESTRSLDGDIHKTCLFSYSQSSNSCAISNCAKSNGEISLYSSHCQYLDKRKEACCPVVVSHTETHQLQKHTLDGSTEYLPSDVSAVEYHISDINREVEDLEYSSVDYGKSQNSEQETNQGCGSPPESGLPRITITCDEDDQPCDDIPAKGQGTTSSRPCQAKMNIFHTLKHNWSWFLTLIKLNLNLLSDNICLLYIAGNFLMNFGLWTVYTHFTNRAIVLGVEKHWAALLTSVIGISNLIGRLLISVTSVWFTHSRLLVFGTLVFLGGVSISTVAVTSTFRQFVAWAALCGATAGGALSLQVTAFVDVVGVEKTSRATSMLMVATALAVLLALPLAGWIYDVSGNYNIPFTVSGLLQTIGAVCILSVYKCHQRSPGTESVITVSQNLLDVNRRPSNIANSTTSLAMPH